MLHLYLGTNKALIRNSLYVLDSWGKIEAINRCSTVAVSTVAVRKCLPEGPSRSGVGNVISCIGGYRSVATGGCRSVATGDYRSVATGDYRSVATGCCRSVATGDYRSVATGGCRSVATGGYRSVATGDYRSVATGDYRSRTLQTSRCVMCVTYNMRNI